MTLPADAVPLEAVRRALVVKLRHHGDVLLASPVIQVLKARAPELEIDALVYAETAPMLALHPGLARLHTVDRAWKSLAALARAKAEWTLYRRLAARRYDLLVHLSESWRGAWLARALGPRWAVAPARRQAPGRWQKSFTHLVPAPRAGGRHEVESNLDALRRIGIHPTAGERALVLEPGEEARRSVDALLVARGLEPGRFVHVHPTSRWHFKGWTVEGWAEVIGRLQAAGWRVALTAAPDETELAVVSAVQQRLAPQAVDLGGHLDLKELAALTAAARLFVGVDSAPMHIAAAMRTPVVALFGPSGEALWGPWGTPRAGRHRVVAHPDYACRPCGLDGCGGGKVSDCLETLVAERVWDAVSAALREAP
jgi:heptosyltransferase-3